MSVKNIAIVVMTGLVLNISTVHAQENTSHNDGQITDSVKAILKRSYAYRSVRIQTLDGVTYLYGTLDTPREVLEAESIAASAPGVKKVVSNLASGPG